MTDQNPSNNPPAPAATPAPTPNPPPAKKGLLTYLLYGGLGLAVIAAASVGTLLLLGGKSTAPVAPGDTDSTLAGNRAAQAAQLTDDQILDSLLAGEDDSDMLALIQENLNVLDYDPAESAAAGDTAPAIEGAPGTADHLAEEQKRLAQWESQLKTRENDLVRRENEVSRQMLVLEQAESARTAGLAKLYDGMDSHAVAKLMTNLDDETVVSILPRMKAKNASEVLQLLPPERAARLSKQMITIAEK
ncbi:MAG TPA: hypothetical protein PKW75_00320 [candidate division Zixibacteria bacterium]|nr:hypothetical protein [candidate division Zixibacteria bacterium]MDD4916810.1 hypothetical protein [candidate division Zixibacteria bacterium]MDM7973411.1 hypothetical protein [candidate division Zixibacteria bacterium]HOD65188.1 hypothetical protein [candidate division Zixibacteria bacterium]HOZ06706.1 hypothetical protein [candidate division Zixibacteria bacterium]